MVEINEPTITITDVESTSVTQRAATGMAGTVVMIGAFPIVGDGKLKSYTNLRTALKDLKGSVDEIPSEALGYHALPYLFNKKNSLGIEELIIVNITTLVDTTLNYDLNNDKLAAALELISDEHFDILFVADTLDSAKLTAIKTLRDDMYAAQLPWGLIAPVSFSTALDIEGISEVFEDGGAYKLITTQKQLKTDATPLSLVNTAAFDVAYTAGQLVNQSETGKIIPGVVGLSTREVFPSVYESILANGLQSQRVINRRLGQLITNNIKTPTGRDLAIERTKDYIVGDLALRDIFSKPNSNPTYDYIKGSFEARKQNYIDLGLIDDMKYEITQCNSKCVKAELDLFVPDIISEIRVYVKVTPTSVEVE